MDVSEGGMAWEDRMDCARLRRVQILRVFCLVFVSSSSSSSSVVSVARRRRSMIFRKRFLR